MTRYLTLILTPGKLSLKKLFTSECEVFSFIFSVSSANIYYSDKDIELWLRWYYIMK